MRTYAKGARTERELMGKFQEMGYSIIRSAGSGVNALSPDIMVFKAGRALCFECKAWDRGSLSLDEDAYAKLQAWARNTLFPTYVAWRISREGWYFVRLEEFSKKEKNYTATKRHVVARGRRLEHVLEECSSARQSVGGALTPL